MVLRNSVELEEAHFAIAKNLAVGSLAKPQKKRRERATTTTATMILVLFLPLSSLAILVVKIAS